MLWFMRGMRCATSNLASVRPHGLDAPVDSMPVRCFHRSFRHCSQQMRENVLLVSTGWRCSFRLRVAKHVCLDSLCCPLTHLCRGEHTYSPCMDPRTSTSERHWVQPHCLEVGTGSCSLQGEPALPRRAR